jgi:hypothetical protein
MQKTAHWLMLAYAVTNAVLYSGLMPLWEGFDELYHYGIVQHYSCTLAPTRVGFTHVPKQLYDSLDYTPVSRYIQPYLQRPSTSFEQYFAFSPEERTARRASLDQLPTPKEPEPSPREDYEAMQSPLTYVVLAPVERALQGVRITWRVFALRAILSALTVVLLWIGMRRLLSEFNVAPAFQTGGLLMLFSCQILYANTSRIGNDSLTLAWLPLFLLSLIRYWRVPSMRNAIMTSVLMSLGLLIKASLLVFVPLVFVPPIPQKKLRPAALSAAILALLAGPWYVRNELLYGSVSANVEATRGAGLQGMIHAIVTLPWLKTAGEMVHAGMWTGNNSFTTFSATTMNVVFLTLVGGCALYLRRARREAPEALTLAAAALAFAGLIAAALFFFSSTNGAIVAPMPWYLPIFWIAVMALATLGFSRQPKFGKWLAAFSAILWSYVMAATWLAKLVPLYGGLDAAHAHVRDLWRWYLEDSARRDSILSNLSPAPLGLIYFLLGLALLLTLASATISVKNSLEHPTNG